MSRLNLAQVRAFLAVARLGGVRRASQALHLSQPAVTTRVRKLEETLSRTLFDRSGSQMVLTREGELFMGYAEKFEHLAELVEKVVVDPEGKRGWLRIGASETITQCWLPDFVSRLHRQFPQVQVELNVDISSNLREALLARQIDLALMLGPVSEYSVDNVELPEFALAWYAAASDGPTSDDTGAFFDQPVITYARNTRPYRELKTLLLERVGPAVPVFPSSSLSACFRLVEAGLGVAALPSALGTPLVEDGRLRTFDPGWIPPPLRFSAVYVGEPKSHLVEVAAQLARESAAAYEGIKKIYRG